MSFKKYLNKTKKLKDCIDENTVRLCMSYFDDDKYDFEEIAKALDKIQKIFLQTKKQGNVNDKDYRDGLIKFIKDNIG